jgi:hypothetical protein
VISVVEKTFGSKVPSFEPFSFDPGSEGSDGEVFRVRHLISKLVTESVRDFRLRERENPLKVLTTEDIAAGLKKGRIGRAREEAQKVDLDLAIGHALQAFEDGIYLIFVDDEEKKSLEEPVSLGPETQVTLIRVTALSGR